MDARITKQRLGNLLSYDWIKILGVIAAAVALLVVLFTMITTRPTVQQAYSVFTYGGLKLGSDSTTLTDRLDGKFSYDILDIKMQNFDAGSLGEQAMAARRGVLEGDAVIVSGYTDTENGSTPFADLCGGYEGYNIGNAKPQGFYIIPELMADAETYLAGFFNGGIADGEIVGERVEEAFSRRNGSDKRFKTAAQREAGIAQERDRVLAIRDNYLFVKAALDGGAIGTVTYHGTESVMTTDGTQAELSYDAEIGIALGKLSGLNDLFFYYQGENMASTELVLLFFDNGVRNEEAKYENFAFLRYLLETYAPAHS